MEDTTSYHFNHWNGVQFFSELSQRIHKIYSLYLQQPVLEGSLLQDHLVFELFLEIVKEILSKPQELIPDQLAYSEEVRKLLLNFASMEKEDKRFSANSWQAHPVYRYLQQHYLLMCDFFEKKVSQIKGLNKLKKKKLCFYMKQFLDAVSPGHFPLTNPKFLQKTLESEGANIIRGLDHFIKDLEASSSGSFQITKTDPFAFQLGKNIAATKGKVVYQNALMQLIQYDAQTKQVNSIPLLIIPPWINKYYILDLSPKNSLVNWIVKQGYTVFIISWVNPNKMHAYKKFEDYLLEGPISALDFIKKRIGEPVVNALGYCIGGTLLACTLGYLSAKKEHRIKSATYLTTLLDFSKPGDLGLFIDQEQVKLLENTMEKEGFLPGKKMEQIFNLLRANDLIWSYYMKHYLQGEPPKPMDSLFWNADSTNLTFASHIFYLKNMYLENCLIKKGGIELANQWVDIKSITVPVYFFSTERDHIAPWKSTYAGIHLHSGPTTFVLGGSGHVAGVINSPRRNKYHYYTHPHKYKQATSFLKNAKKTLGSWWPHWETWLKQQSGDLILAASRKINKKDVIEQAPGSFVQVAAKNSVNLLLKDQEI